MLNSTNCFTTSRDGKTRVNSIEIYRSLSSEIVKKIDDNLSVGEVLEWIRCETKKYFYAKYSQEPTVGALNNAIGRWNELIATSLLSEIALEIYENTGEYVVIFSLPNSKVQTNESTEAPATFLNIFNNTDPSNIKALERIQPFKSKIFLPSPDYIIAVVENRETFNSVKPHLEQQAKDPESMAIYNLLKGKLQLEEVKAAVSLKTSNRPDRRYQPLFEAAMIKAIWKCKLRWQRLYSQRFSDRNTSCFIWM
jgi:hypothetical protein